MQPHSMCAAALVGYIWNSHDNPKISKCVMSVEYRNRFGEYKNNSYDLTDVEQSSDGRELKIRIMRSGGGLACKVVARRSSTSEGSKIAMTHETIHVSGLREEFKLYSMDVSEGMHYNSMRYRRFAGHFGAARESLNLVCEIKRDDDSYYSAAYKLTMTQLTKA